MREDLRLMVGLLIHLNETTLKKLQEIAQQEQKPVEEIAARLIEKQTNTSDVDDIIEVDFDAPPGTLAALAASAVRANLASEEEVDTAEHADEILNNEFGEYLKRREQNIDGG
jgi:hypothetical protein